MQGPTSEQAEKLEELLSEIRTPMMTTRHGDQLRSRPMTTLENDYSAGTLWFMTSWKTEKAGEIEAHSGANVSYSEPGKNRYISVSGKAELVMDPVKAKELWNPFAKVWFDGPDDPDLILVKFVIEGVEYWDGPGNKMVALYSLAKALVTGDDSHLADNDSFQTRSSVM